MQDPILHTYVLPTYFERTLSLPSLNSFNTPNLDYSSLQIKTCIYGTGHKDSVDVKCVHIYHVTTM